MIGIQCHIASNILYLQPAVSKFDFEKDFDKYFRNNNLDILYYTEEPWLRNMCYVILLSDGLT